MTALKELLFGALVGVAGGYIAIKVITAGAYAANISGGL
jgi:hypothetical protein